MFYSVFTFVHNHEQTLRIIQHAWLGVDTREDAINLLPLAIGVISLNPQIGTAFHEPFAWVDAFLKE